MGLILLCCSLVTAHRYYFGMSEIKVNTDKKTLELSCKLFTDDVEEALFRLNHSKVDLERSEDDKLVQQQLYNYLHERFHIVINGNPCELQWVGFETENEITWFYLEGKVNVTKTSQIKMKITNSLLYDFIPEQANVMQVLWNAEERTERLVNPDKEVDLTLPSP